MTTRSGGVPLTDETVQRLADDAEKGYPLDRMRPRGKVAQGRSGGVAYANASQLKSLADYIQGLTISATETGWHSPNMIVTLGEGEEAIVIGVRWLNHTGEYVAEIR